MNMKRLFLSLITCLFFQSAIVNAEDVPDYVGKYTSTAEDTKAINNVIEDFQKAILKKDGDLLKSLFMNEEITFFSPPPQKNVDFLREKHNLDFWESYNFRQSNTFVKFISTGKDQTEERFYNVKITQDNNYGLVVFDYDFRQNGAVLNWGIETWQLFKLDGKWLISTVMWSVNRLEEPIKIPE